MESAFEHEEPFSDVKEESFDPYDGEKPLRTGNDEMSSVKEEKEDEPFAAFNAHVFLSNEDLVSGAGKTQGNWEISPVKEEFVDTPLVKEEVADDEMWMPAGYAASLRESMGSGNQEQRCLVDGCTETVSSSEHLLLHLGMHPMPLHCGVCQRSCSNASSLRVHYRTHTGEKPFKCKICLKTFAHESSLHVHQRLHTGELPYACNICDYKTHRKQSLTNHKWNNHSEEKPYSCPICRKDFGNASRLARHLHTHPECLPYACGICDYKAAKPVALEMHQRTHIGEKPHSCAICGRSFIQLENLATHMRTHTEKRSFKCGDCNFCALDYATLRIHNRIHTKPYSCSICGKLFAYSSGLSLHRRTHARRRLY